MFKLDEKLQADTFFVTDLTICQLLLMNNTNYPWLILVPRIHDAVELTDLPFATQMQILREVNFVADILQQQFSPHKLNIATLGNVVRQLHIHVIARFKNDVSFPKSVWNGPEKNYDEQTAQNFIQKINNEILQHNLLCKQVLYRSIHRGCKETDHLVGNFAQAKLADFFAKELRLFEKFIIEDDLLIYDWIMAKEQPPQHYQNLVEEMQKFHNIAKDSS